MLVEVSGNVIRTPIHSHSPSVNSHSRVLKVLLPFPFQSKYRSPFPSAPFPKNRLNVLFTYDLLTKYHTTLHNFTLQEMSLQIAMQQVVHSARGKASTALLRCATGDTEDSFACRGCCIESLYKTDGNLHVQYIPISSHSHSIIPHYLGRGAFDF